MHRFFFWNNYCGALGGPTSAIFGRDHRDPLKFDANLFLDPSDHPYTSKMSKKSKFSPSWLSREKNHLKVGVYRENFNIGNVAENFFMDFYICWQYAISFSANFPMLKFSPGASTLAPPLSRGFFEIWLKNENDQFWGGKKIFPSILKKDMKV